MLDHPPVEYVRALMWGHDSLGTDAEVEGVEIIDPIAYPLAHSGQEALQGFRFLPPSIAMMRLSSITSREGEAK